MKRALLIALAGLLMSIGCSQADSPAEHHREGREETLAEYHVRDKKTCQIASQSATCYSVSTHALSGEAFTAFTQHFRNQSGGVDNVVVTFFFDEPQARSTGMGFAFESKEAARSILSRFFARQKHTLQDADLDEEVSKAMQNDGIYAVSVDDEAEQQMCESWDSKRLGPPPKQWDCPGW